MLIMELQTLKLSQIIQSIKTFHYIEESEIQKIESTFALLINSLSISNVGLNEENIIYYTNHSLSIAQRMALWRFDCNTVAAALLYVLPVDGISTLTNLKPEVDNDTYVILEGCVNIHNLVISTHLSDFSDTEQTQNYELCSRYPKAFYIEIAAHMDVLLRNINNQNEKILTFAQKTREILIPQVKYMHAYKMADSLEELCFRIENKATYDTASSIIREVDELNEFSRQKFITKLKQIFDKNSKITPAGLQEYQSYIKLFFAKKRSLASIYRFITQNNPEIHSVSTLSTDMIKLKNFARTAFCDLTLVVDDQITGNDSCSTVDVFMQYFESQLRPLGVFLYGYYRTTNKDACYFLLSDSSKNMYRFFVKSESQHLCYLYGDFLVQDEFIRQRQPKKNENQIKVFKKDGTAKMVERGITVLDFAFMIHEDLGLYFGNAILNQNGKLQPAYTVLNNGDTVEIKKSPIITAELNWFRYLKTDLAVNYLIKYFKTQFKQAKEVISVLTRDGRKVLLEKGTTVLDFAFATNGDNAILFDYALINHSEKHYAEDYILCEGDTVIIRYAATVQANYDWFKYAKTTQAINSLIEYFKSKDKR